jgi:hypothetical protein
MCPVCKDHRPARHIHTTTCEAVSSLNPNALPPVLSSLGLNMSRIDDGNQSIDGEGDMSHGVERHRSFSPRPMKPHKLMIRMHTTIYQPFQRSRRSPDLGSEKTVKQDRQQADQPDLSTGWIRIRQLSIAKHIRYNRSRYAHKLKPTFAGSSGSGYLGYKDGICTHRITITSDKTYWNRTQYVGTRSKSILKPYMNQVRDCLCPWQTNMDLRRSHVWLVRRWTSIELRRCRSSSSRAHALSITKSQIPKR